MTAQLAVRKNYNYWQNRESSGRSASSPALPQRKAGRDFVVARRPWRTFRASVGPAIARHTQARNGLRDVAAHGGQTLRAVANGGTSPSGYRTPPSALPGDCDGAASAAIVAACGRDNSTVRCGGGSMNAMSDERMKQLWMQAVRAPWQALAPRTVRLRWAAAAVIPTTVKACRTDDPAEAAK